MRANIEIYNEDCLTAMKAMPDKFYDLAIVDPPYGIGEDGAKNHSRSKAAKAKQYTPKNWDAEAPQQEYFTELMRVSKNQIIWGANHFIERINKNSSCWIVWDKMNGDNDFADCELAWTNFDKAVRQFRFRWAGMLQGNMKDKEIRIHPTQKPVQLYKWLLQKFATPEMKILDTHIGSGSIAVACWDLGIDLVGYEIDKEYYDNARKRIEQHTLQTQLF
jgi:site-specific DNA-methyltransferase (adenine-specific)